MQGDIFMLDQTTMQVPAKSAAPVATTTTTTKITKSGSTTKLQSAVAQVAIYNEDDLSHLLFTEAVALDNHHPHHHHHHEHHQDGSLTPLTAPASSGTHTPLFEDAAGLSDSESAVLEDWEEDAELEVPQSPSPRRRGGTMCSTDDDFEWPVFLGRQADEMAPRRLSSYSSVSSSSQAAEDAAPKSRVAVPEEHHVSNIEGPLMSLWPTAPVDVLEWTEEFYE